MDESNLGLKKKIGVSLDEDVVAWLDEITRLVGAQRKDISRSKVLNCLLRKIMVKKKPEDVAYLILKSCTEVHKFR